MELELIRKEHHLEIWLNRPEKLNALTDRMMWDLRSAIEEVEEDEEIHAIIIRGRGRAFSAGFDISPREEPRSTPREWRKHFKDGNDAFRAIRRSSKPVIAAVHGPCMGGAFEMTMACDIVIATPQAFFGETEIRFGGTAMFLMLPYVAPPRVTQRLLLTGERISAVDALGAHIITEVATDDDDLEGRINEYLKTFSALPPGTATMNKRVMARVFDMMGAQEATELSEDLAIVAIMSKEGNAAEFDRVTREQGLTAAIRWRDSQFGTTAQHQATKE